MSVELAPASGGGEGTPTGTTPTGAAPSGNPSPAAPAAPSQPGVTITAGNASPADDKGKSQDTPWYSGLTEDNRKLAETKGWKTLDDAMKSYSELQSAFSGKQDALIPKTPAEYTFKVPENAKDVGYDTKFADAFKDWAHKAKVPNDAAASLHDSFVAYAAEAMKGQMASSQEALNKSLTTAETALVDKWGAQDSPAFKRGVELARRAIDQLGLGDVLKSSGAIVDGKIANAKAIIALATVGQTMYAEDTVFGGPATQSNPFDPKTVDYTAQAQVFKQDPQKAKLLIMSLPKAEQAKYDYLLSQVR